MTQDRIEAFAERAAIIEHESGEHVPRAEAERRAVEYLQMTEDEIEFLQGANIAKF